MSEVKIALRTARAALVAEFQFRQRQERIRWEEEVLKPELERLALQIGDGEMPIYELVNETED